MVCTLYIFDDKKQENLTIFRKNVIYNKLDRIEPYYFLRPSSVKFLGMGVFCGIRKNLNIILLTGVI